MRTIIERSVGATALRRWVFGMICSVVYGLNASPALACPDCRVGRAARAEVFGDAFLSHLGLIALPSLIIGVIAALLHRVGMPARKRGQP